MRIKRGVTTHQKHKKLRKAAKGMTKSRRSSPRMARQALNKSLSNAYRDRRNRKRDFRSLWIARINAGAKENGTTYSRLMHGLKEAKVELDRKVLSEIAVREPKAFEAIVKAAKKT